MPQPVCSSRGAAGISWWYDGLLEKTLGAKDELLKLQLSQMSTQHKDDVFGATFESKHRKNQKMSIRKGLKTLKRKKNEQAKTIFFLKNGKGEKGFFC